MESELIKGEMHDGVDGFGGVAVARLTGIQHPAKLAAAVLTAPVGEHHVSDHLSGREELDPEGHGVAFGQDGCLRPAAAKLLGDRVAVHRSEWDESTDLLQRPVGKQGRGVSGGQRPQKQTDGLDRVVRTKLHHGNHANRAEGRGGAAAPSTVFLQIVPITDNTLQMENKLSKRRAITGVVVLAGALETLLLRRRGYSLGGNVIVRCRAGHLFTTIWVPMASVKSIRLGWWRFQRCPVGSHWSLVSPVKEADLSESERLAARAHKDVRIP